MNEANEVIEATETSTNEKAAPVQIKAAAVFIIMKDDKELELRVQTDDPVDPALFENMNNKEWIEKEGKNHNIHIVDALAITLATQGQALIQEAARDFQSVKEILKDG